jgi:hypothetical protein
MRITVALVLIALVILLSYKRETYMDMFGYSGHSDPINGIVLEDKPIDKSNYRYEETKMNNDTIQKIILATNAAIEKKTKVCNYIIETLGVKKFVKKDNSDKGPMVIHQASFMAVKEGGFAFGFAVTVDVDINRETPVVMSLQTQPMDSKVLDENAIKAFTEGKEGQEFISYDLVKRAALPKKSELESAKNKIK